jgi:hypothetical protein
MGRVCSTTELPGLMAEKFNAQIHCLYPRRLGFWRIELHLERIHCAPTASGVTLGLNHWLEENLADLCLVAAGQLDVFWEFGLKPWDIAAGSLIATEAQATVTDTNGELLDLFGQDILATNGLVHERVIEEFSQLA